MENRVEELEKDIRGLQNAVLILIFFCLITFPWAVAQIVTAILD